MFCECCGAEINAGASFCSGCGIATETRADVTRPAESAGPSEASGAVSVAEHAKVASRDTLHTLKAFVRDPTGSILPVYESLDPKRAIGVGIALAILFDVCFLFAGSRILSEASGYIPFLNLYTNGLQVPWGKLFFLGLLPYTCIALALFTAHKVFRGSGAAHGAMLVAGLSLLPMALAVAFSSIIGIGNVEVIAVLFLFAQTYTILILFIGCVRIAQISESAAALAVPLILLFSVWLMKIAFTTLLSSGFLR